MILLESNNHWKFLYICVGYGEYYCLLMSPHCDSGLMLLLLTSLHYIFTFAIEKCNVNRDVLTIAYNLWGVLLLVPGCHCNHYF